MDKRRKIGKAKERKEKVKRGKDEEVNGQGEEGCPSPTRGHISYDGVDKVINARKDLMSAARVERFADRWFMSSSCASSAPPLLPVAPLLPPRLICCAVTFKDSNTPC